MIHLFIQIIFLISAHYVPGTVLGAGIEIYLANTQGFRQMQSQLALCLKEINYYDLFMIALHSGFQKGRLHVKLIVVERWLWQKMFALFFGTFLNGILIIKNINLTSTKGSLSVSHYLYYILKQIFTNSYRYSCGLNQVKRTFK